MHFRSSLLFGALLLTACTLPEVVPEPMTDTGAVMETETGEVAAITLEPFTDPMADATQTGSYVPLERTLSGGILEIGSMNADLTITVFLNAESPYARAFQQTIMPLLLTEFVQPGNVSVRIVPLTIQKYAGSAAAALTVYCAGAQGKGYSAHSLLFATEQTGLTERDIASLSLDAASFQSCLQTTLASALAGQAVEAQKYDVTLVPTYSIGGRRFVGLPTDADLRGQIREAL